MLIWLNPQDALDASDPGQSVMGVEVVRTVAEDKASGDTQTAWDAYHAWGALPGESPIVHYFADSVHCYTGQSTHNHAITMPYQRCCMYGARVHMGAVFGRLHMTEANTTCGVCMQLCQPAGSAKPAGSAPNAHHAH